MFSGLSALWQNAALKKMITSEEVSRRRFIKLSETASVPCLTMNILESDPVRHDERLAIVAGEPLVCFGMAEELFLLRVHFQDHAQGRLGLREIDSVACEVFGHTFERFQRLLLAFDLFADRVRVPLAAELVGDVARVAERAGEVTFQDVGIEIGVLATSDRVDEVL